MIVWRQQLASRLHQCNGWSWCRWMVWALAGCCSGDAWEVGLLPVWQWETWSGLRVMGICLKRQHQGTLHASVDCELLM